jgi:glycosyltransferase involved in cell wall biosynthesis
LVEDGKTGYLFDPHNLEELVDCIARVCGDLDHASELGRAAQVKIADWSCERFARNALLAAKAAMGDFDAGVNII